MRKIDLFILILCLCTIPVFVTGENDEIVLKVEWYSPGDRGSISSVCDEFMKQHKNVLVVPYTQLQIEGGLGYDSAKLMSFAGETAPDIVHMWFHLLRNYVEQGFLCPLNEYIGEDKNGNGIIEDKEATKYPEWKNIDPYYRKVATVNGKVYALPFGNYNLGLLYRIDLFRNAGLDPNKPPKTWDEFFYCMQKLIEPKRQIPGAVFQRGQRGYGIYGTGEGSWELYPWFWSSGEDMVKVTKKNPATGKVYEYPKETIYFTDPETGEDLTKEQEVWKANFASNECLKALDFLHKLRWQKWIRNPKIGEPINLTDDDVFKGFVKDPVTDKKITFKKEDVIEGVIRAIYGRDETSSTYDLLNKGEVAVIFGGVGKYLGALTFNPTYIGFMPFPKGPNGKQVVFRTPNWRGLNSSLLKDKKKRDAAWELLAGMCGKPGRIAETKYYVETGNAKFLFPEELSEAGMSEYIDEIPSHWRKSYKELTKYGYTEPYTGFWQPVGSLLMGNQLTARIFSERDFPYMEYAKKLESEATLEYLTSDKEPILGKYRKPARIIFIFIILIVLGLIYKLMKQIKEKAKEVGKSTIVTSTSTKEGISTKFTPWILLMPAIVLIALWAYYPVMRGSVMAFQNYKILGDVTWVGLDNFIEVMISGKFWKYSFITVKFVVLTLGIGFFIPLVLAILLSEIPTNKTFFRTMFYLPQVASGLVIMFLWKLMYNPTEYGLLNQILHKLFGFLGFIKQDWLGSSSTAMISVIVPGIWAGAGAGCLIYLAALKTVSEDMYEVAEVEGAGILKKIWYVTLPILKPLIIINFVGAFIGAFRGMGDIFVMTGGGPGEETMVLSLVIWYRAFASLQFGIATSMAWILGIMLIGFTVWQLQILKKVEFKRAEKI